MAHLLMAPLNDGGQWDMFCSLIEKYGVVPKDAMPETACSSATREITGYMTRKLREFACTLRTGHQNGKDLEELRGEKEGMMQTIYNMLCIALGKPPKTLTLEVRNKKKEFLRDEGLTGKEFFQKYIGWDLSQYVSLINAPTADKMCIRDRSSPSTLSYSLSFAVSIITGSFLVAGSARRRFKICRPSSSGSIISSRIRLGVSFSIAAQNSEGLEKPTASKPVEFMV